MEGCSICLFFIKTPILIILPVNRFLSPQGPVDLAALLFCQNPILLLGWIEDSLLGCAALFQNTDKLID